VWESQKCSEEKGPPCRYGPANAPIKTVYQSIREMLPQAEVVYKKGCHIIDSHFPVTICIFSRMRMRCLRTNAGMKGNMQLKISKRQTDSTISKYLQFKEV